MLSLRSATEGVCVRGGPHVVKNTPQLANLVTRDLKSPPPPIKYSYCEHRNSNKFNFVFFMQSTS